MLIPIRCMTCGKPVAQCWEEFQQAVKQGRNKKNALDKLGIERYCCRSLFLTHVDLIPRIGRFR